MKPKYRTFIALLLFAGQTLMATDKSGVSPNTISLPKGPGAIEGLGESFQPSLNTGTAKYSIALKVAAGTAGRTPELRLSYEGGGGNGSLGFGWSLPISSIQRRSDQGIPTYGEYLGIERKDRFINDFKEELVPQATGYWFCKNEGAFIRYQLTNGYWEATAPDGTRFHYGVSASARIQDGTNRIFSWLLERETDTRGNVIEYFYASYPDATDLHQKYLTEIRYGPGAPPWSNFHFVALVYEDRSDWFEDCRAGFPIRTGKRLKRILMGTQGPALSAHRQGDYNGDGITDHLDRKYELNYLPYAGQSSHWSLLASVQMIGADGSNALPASTFNYIICDPPDQLSVSGKEIGGINEPSAVMDNSQVDLVDLNGDGLPDIVNTAGPVHQGFINLGETNAAGTRMIRWGTGIDVASGSGDAWNFTLSADATHLADMDGDGLADLVHKVAVDGSIFYFANRGNSSWSERRNMDIPLGSIPPPAPFGEPNVRTADIDFDKRIDLIRADGVDYQVWFNLGGNTYSDRFSVPQDTSVDFALPMIQLVDFNGDRVPDVCRVRPSSIQVQAGIGYGRFLSLHDVAIPDWELTSEQLNNAKLTDLNGDGLADLVIEQRSQQEVWYWLNLGNYTLSSRKRIGALPASIGLNATVRWADLNGNGTTDLIFCDSGEFPRLRIFDLGELLNCGSIPNALNVISNGIGRATLIGYAPSTKFAAEDAAAGHAWTNLMPNPVTVVACVTNLDSLGNSYVTEFRYHDGYYDAAEKQFRGFARVEQVDLGDLSAPTLVTRSYFDTGRHFEAMKGKLLRLSTETDGGLIFTDDVTGWALPPVVLHTGTNGTNVVYAHPIGHKKTIKELGQGAERVLESELAFDQFGNQTTNADYGIVEGGNRSAFNDERITVTEYALNVERWIVRHPSRQEIRDEVGATISRAESFYDDETFSGNNFGTVTIGNLTLRREWVDPASPNAYVNTARTKYDSYGNPIVLLDPLGVAPGGALQLQRGHYRELEYDSRFYAYPVREIIQLGSGQAPLGFRAQYDEGFGMVTASLDFNTNQTTYAYDPFARLVNIVKPYDTAEYPTVEYDYALAIPADYSSADGLVRRNGLVNYIETRQRDRSEVRNQKSEMYFRSRQFVDGLGRKIMSKTEAEPAPGSSVPRVAVSQATLFNARQKPSRVVNSYFSLSSLPPGGTAQGEAALDGLLDYEDIRAPSWKGQFQDNGQLVELDLNAAHQSLIEYDATLREIRQNNPDGTSHRTTYEPLLTRSFDENQTDPASPQWGASMAHISDGLGRLIQVDEVTHLNDDGTSASSVKAWTTRYEYDLNDQLTKVLDSQDNVKLMTYDGLKRKLSLNDPDRGRMTYRYDDASNLIETTDAKSQRITYTYDGANRIRTEDYHDEGQPSSANRVYDPAQPLSGSNRPDVAYFYDVAFSNLPQGDNTTATPRNTKGMLAYVWDLSGEEHTSYDARGRMEYMIKRIPDPVFWTNRAMPISPLWLVSYRTGFEYDSMDRTTRLIYPDNDEIIYEYNERSLLKRIPGGPNGSIISNIVYQPSSQQAQIDYGNTVRTTYDYDNRLRLRQLRTWRPANALLGGGELDFIHFHYDFDGVSNIRQITDNRPDNAVPGGEKRRNTQLYEYDDLYRLTRAQYSFTLPGQPIADNGHINYRYDRIGNMVSQTSDIQHYENGLSLTQLGDMSYGGNAGKSGRIGRGANDPPGPHALTAVSELATNNPQPRLYPYDANGNMTEIDGLICTWDFKDRLVAVENAQMRADYTYDHTDRRVIKRVAQKKTNAVKGLHSSPCGSGGMGETTPNFVLYVGKHFEVREHDAPTKYVFNGNTRVARVTGSLGTTLRIQRLRLFPGWNLCSLAVTAPFSAGGAGQAELIAYRWNPSNLDWQLVLNEESLPAGTVLWFNLAASATLTFLGPYLDPTNRIVSVAGEFLPSAGLEVWDFESTACHLPLAGASTYNALSAHWLPWLPPPLGPQADFPAAIAPGEAVFVQAEALGAVGIPEPALRIRYYHQDHLGSSSLLSDAAADTVEERTYYAFGKVRTDYPCQRTVEFYGFTQMEWDTESGLGNYEARFHEGLLARFTKPDPLSSRDDFGDPRTLNCYAYCRNRPTRFVDPSGMAEEPAKHGGENEGHSAEIGTWLITGGTLGMEQFLEWAAHHAHEHNGLNPGAISTVGFGFAAIRGVALGIQEYNEKGGREEGVIAASEEIGNSLLGAIAGALLKSPSLGYLAEKTIIKPATAWASDAASEKIESYETESSRYVRRYPVSSLNRAEKLAKPVHEINVILAKTIPYSEPPPPLAFFTPTGIGFEDPNKHMSYFVPEKRRRKGH